MQEEKFKQNVYIYYVYIQYTYMDVIFCILSCGNPSVIIG